MTGRLVVSLAGIDTRTLHRCADLAEEMQKRSVPLSLLFAPRRDGAVADWVRTRRAAGDAVLMHGFDHSPEPRGRTMALGRRAEFAALPAHEAGLRLTAAVATMDRLGLATDAFAPPRWYASRGTVTALARKGFTLCADLYGVRDLRTDGVHRSRVLGLAQTERAETLWCFTFVLAAARVARRGGLVRLAVDAADLARPGLRQAVLDAVDNARIHGADGVTYPDVLAPRVRSRSAAVVPSVPAVI